MNYNTIYRNRIVKFSGVHIKMNSEVMSISMNKIESEVEGQLSKKFIEDEIQKLNIKIDENKNMLIERISFKN